MNRFKSYVPFVVLASYALICLLLFVDSEWHPQWDSGIYLLTARNLANGQGYTYLGQPFFLRPPGFSYFLSWIVNPEGDFDFYKLNLIVMFLAMGALAIVYILMKRFLSKMQSLGITLLLGTSPLFVSQFNNIMSEFLFLILFLGGVCLILPTGKGSSNPVWRGLLGAVLISVSLYIRTVGIVFLPGLIAMSFHNQTRAEKVKGLVQVSLILLLLVPWIRFSSHASEQAAKPTTQLMIFSYATSLFHVDSGDPASPYIKLGDWTKRISRNSVRLVQEIGQNIFHGTGKRALASSMLVCIGFFIACWRGWSIFEWLTFSYTCIIILYTYYDSRLVFVLLPFFYYYYFITMSFVISLCENRYKINQICKAAFALSFALVLSLNVVSMTKYLSKDLGRDQNWAPLYTAAQWIKTNTQKDAIILHEYAPIFAVIADRSVYTYLFLHGNDLPEANYIVLTRENTYFEQHLKMYNLDSVVLPGNPEFGGVRIYHVR